MAKTSEKTIARQKRVQRIRKKLIGTSSRPRLRVFKSARHIYAQLIDDSNGFTVSSYSSLKIDLNHPDVKGKILQAKKVGQLVAENAKIIGIESVVFDRGGYIYHGRVKALADGAREGGLVF